ncbi:hypothetical protein F5Y15DRAFT_416652 [Xylariaceae sp. FL0016]|nr:hypothetical protein F5Y15DRAFT_416652 [Xylariaceae sp. FL0016]
MARRTIRLGLAAWAISLSGAQDIVYVTDLSIFTVLAPCAQSALSYNIFGQTNANCPEGVTELQSCVCTKDNNDGAISTGISESISYSCGPTATEDQASAASVFEAYCNQGEITPFPEPESPVTEYITDLPAWQELAPCAASGLSEAVQMMTYDLCPPDASLLATCVCDKNQNSLRASQDINTSVKYSCSSHTADVASAHAVFAGYCGLGNGTSSFPETTNPPGDMTYYITALPEYSFLAPCAQSAVSYNVLSQTYDLCPEGPQALASCACLKGSMSSLVSSLVVSGVKYSCESTASEDVTSALGVIDIYCSAAKALTTPSGITESVDQVTAAGNTGANGPTETGGSGNSGSESSDGSDGSIGGSASSASRTSNTGVIAGAVVGTLVVVTLIGLAAFIIWRRLTFMRRHQLEPQEANVPTGDTGSYGKPELDGSTGAPATTTSPVSTMGKANIVSRTDNVSPVSSHTVGHISELQSQGQIDPPPVPPVPELQNRDTGVHAQELHGQGINARQTTYSPQSVHEAYGQQIHEASGRQQSRIHEAHGQARSELQGQAWQSGPVPGMHEMDEGYTALESRGR